MKQIRVENEDFLGHSNFGPYSPKIEEKWPFLSRFFQYHNDVKLLGRCSQIIGGDITVCHIFQDRHPGAKMHNLFCSVHFCKSKIIS